MNRKGGEFELTCLNPSQIDVSVDSSEKILKILESQGCKRWQNTVSVPFGRISRVVVKTSQGESVIVEPQDRSYLLGLTARADSFEVIKIGKNGVDNAQKGCEILPFSCEDLVGITLKPASFARP